MEDLYSVVYALIILGWVELDFLGMDQASTALPAEEVADEVSEADVETARAPRRTSVSAAAAENAPGLPITPVAAR